jgi:CheY-like chemotaxis protein
MLLVVDDNYDVRMLLRISLRSAGYQVDEAADGQEALRCVNDREYDAVVLDQKMPGMTGLQVAERIRTTHPQLPVVLFSAYLDGTLSATAERLGLHVVTKTDLPGLVAVVQAAAGG